MKVRNYPALIWLGIIILILSLGFRQSFGLFMKPVSEFFEVGREFFSFAIALQNLLFGLFQPFIGMASDRFGPRRIIMLGAIAYAAGLALTSVAAQPEWLYLSLGALVGLGLSCTSYVIVLGAVARVVPAEHSAKAFGLTTAAGSFGMFAVIPGAQALLTEFDWQGALQIFAILCTSMVAFAAFMRIPESTKPAAGAPVAEQTLKQALAEAFRTPSYWLLNLGFFVCGFHVMFIATHLSVYLEDFQLSPETAAMALSYVGIFNIFGSYFWGMMGDRHDKRHVMFALYMLRVAIIAAFILVPVSSYSAAAFGAAIGFCWLGTVPLTSGLVRQIFGPRYMSTLYGIVFFTHQIGSFLGAWMGGRVYDAVGSYNTMWWLAIGLGLLAALIHLPINPKPIERSVPATA